MTCAQNARRCLKGHWTAAVTVECISMAAGLLIPLAWVGALRLLGVNAERVVHTSELFNDGWIYAVVSAALFIIDWLLISPITLGRLSFYCGIASGTDTPVNAVFRFFGRHYTHALRWRFFRSLQRLIYTAVCILPAAAAVGITRAVGQSEINSPAFDMIMLLGTVFGFVFILLGLLVSEILMVRKLPAAYLLANMPVYLHANGRHDKYPKRLFRSASRYMRGHVIDTFQLTAGFSGWFLSCILFLPCFYVLPLVSTARAAKIMDIIELNESKVSNDDLTNTIQFTTPLEGIRKTV